MSEAGVRALIVVGDGLAGVMTAAALVRALPAHRFTVHLVPTGGADHSIGFDQPADCARPTLRRFHDMLGMEEEQLIAETGASFSLGTAWSGWSPSAPTFFLPFGEAGAALGGVPFHQLAARLRAAGRKVRLSDYSAATLMAQAGRFTKAPADPRSPLSSIDHALHLPRAAHRDLLLRCAVDLGLRVAPAKFRGASVASDGTIDAVMLDDGSRIEGWLFIDASGPSALLSSNLGGGHFHSWRQWLAVDRLLISEQASDVPPAPYGHLQAHAAGWRLQVPAQGRVGEALAYASGQLGDEEASRLTPGAGSPAQLEQGRLDEPWRGNIVAIGAAAAVLEPHSGLGLHLVQSAIERLLRLLPHELPAPPEQREFNRETSLELDRARDLVIASYALNGRIGEPLFDSARSADLPDELASKLALYRSRGRVTLLDGDLLEEPEWALFLDEFGVRPRRYDALADGLPLEWLEAQFARMRELLIAAVRPLPLHGDYLRSRLSRAAA